MSESEIKIIYPFRFRFQEIKFRELTGINWDLLSIQRLGEYRKLTIIDGSRQQINISDLEFINFNSLEKRLLEKTILNLNLNRKLNIELQQAKWNRWLNLFVIGVFIFFFALLSSTHQNNINVLIRIAIIIIVSRLFVRLVQYQKCIKQQSKKKFKKTSQSN